MTSPVPLTNIEVLSLTWQIFGGWRTLLRSKDFWVSVFVTAISFHVWVHSNWWDTVISVVPSLLGFTLSGFAIFLSFGSDEFKRLISSTNELKSPYLSTSAAFMAFVTVQVAALLYALCAKSLAFPTPDALTAFACLLKRLTPIADGVGYLLFIYSLMLALRAALRIFRLSRWLNWYLVVVSTKEGQMGPRSDKD